MKFSKDLLELRDKEAKLVRMKRYEEAEKVKMKADLLEEFERNKLEAEVSLTYLNLLTIQTGVDASGHPKEGGQAAPLAATRAGSAAETDPTGPQRTAEAQAAGLATADPAEQEHFERPADQAECGDETHA